MYRVNFDTQRLKCGNLKPKYGVQYDTFSYQQ